jgi:HAD superfamily hydrolase (TIGR01509 family)
MPIRAVVFDLDGLMFNTEDVFELAGDELLRRRGLRMTPEIRDGMIGRRPPEAFRHLLDVTGLDEPIERLQAEIYELVVGLLDAHLKPMPGLLDLLADLERRRLPKAVATSSPRGYMTDILRRFELLPRFAFTLTAEDVARGKPAPDIYLKAAETLGLAPAEILVLEDSEMGTRAASAAGAVVVSVPHRHTARHDFSVATHVASGLGDPLISRLLDAPSRSKRFGS